MASTVCVRMKPVLAAGKNMTAEEQKMLGEAPEFEDIRFIHEVRNCEERSDELGIRQLRSKFSRASSSSLGIDTTIIAAQF